MNNQEEILKQIEESIKRTKRKNRILVFFISILNLSWFTIMMLGIIRDGFTYTWIIIGILWVYYTIKLIKLIK